MKRGMFGMVLCSMVLGVGCAQPVEEDSGEASGAVNGTPSAEVDRGALDAKRSIWIAYRAAERSRLTERSGSRCPVPEGTRWFALDMRTASTPAEKLAFPAAMATLQRSAYDPTRLIIKQSPTSNAARSDLTFYGTYEGAVECGLRPLLSCTSVGADDGPTEAQCGLTAR